MIVHNAAHVAALALEARQLRNVAPLQTLTLTQLSLFSRNPSFGDGTLIFGILMDESRTSTAAPLRLACPLRGSLFELKPGVVDASLVTRLHRSQPREALILFVHSHCITTALAVLAKQFSAVVEDGCKPYINGYSSLASNEAGGHLPGMNLSTSGG